MGCPREREHAARSEVQYFVGDLLDDHGLVITGIPASGLLTCSTTIDPFLVVHRLSSFALENPYQFRFSTRFTPVECCVPSTIDDIMAAAGELKSKIGASESFRVTVRHRRTALDSMKVVRSVAGLISQRVDLKKPDKTVWIEIVGDLTGVTVLVPEKDILSVATLQGCKD